MRATTPGTVAVPLAHLMLPLILASVPTHERPRGGYLPPALSEPKKGDGDGSQRQGSADHGSREWDRAATARAMAAQGAKVAICDVDADNGKRLADEIGETRGLSTDITDGNSCDGVAEIVGALGKLDIAHLNAGVVMRPYGTPTMEPFFDHLTYANINRIVGINVLGVVLGTAAVLPHLEASKGYLLMTTSPAGMGAWPVDPLYSVTKSAVNTRCAAWACSSPRRASA